MTVLDSEFETLERVESRRLPFDLRSTRLPESTGVITAVLLAVAGFGLIGFTWLRVSDYTNVAKQMPYVISGGLTGLALVIMGAAVLIVVTRKKDENTRINQTHALVEAINRLQRVVEGVDKQ